MPFNVQIFFYMKLAGNISYVKQFCNNITRIKESDNNEKDIYRKQRYRYLICDSSINQTKLF